MDELVFAKLAKGYMCEVYYTCSTHRIVLIAQIDQGARKETKTFASCSIPGCLVVKVNDAKAARKQSKCSAYDTTNKKSVCSRVACNCFYNSWRKVKAESEEERSDSQIRTQNSENYAQVLYGRG